MLINELKRSLKSKKFLIIIIIGLLIHFLSLYMEVKDFIFFNYNASDLQAPEIQAKARHMIEKAFNIYAVWFSIFQLYAVAMPIISALPFSLSYLEDKEYGIIKYIDVRINHRRYLITKTLANSIAGGLAVALPTIIMTIFIHIFFKGSINDFYGKGVYGGIFTSLLTYSFWLYSLLHIFIEFMFGFAYANIALAVSAFIKNKIAIMLSPFLFWISISVVFNFLNIQHYSTERINQFYMIPTVTVREIFIELTFITITSALLFIFKSGKRNIYEC
ncbi:hypothetical protein [Clostridium sp. BJN0013]|uniref:hypothetical protein n=1 Tax=Clostridium sp. BJN0013 TaxID=3236840 RepID=UPI0034C688CC